MRNEREAGSIFEKDRLLSGRKNGKKVSFASLDQRSRNGSNLPFSHNKQNRGGNGAGIEQIA